MLFTTTQEHEELRKRIRKFAEEEIKPQAFELDQTNGFPGEAVAKLGQMGLMGAEAEIPRASCQRREDRRVWLNGAECGL